MALTSSISNEVIFTKADLVQAVKDYLNKHNQKGDINQVIIALLITSSLETADDNTPVLTANMPIVF